MPYGTLNADVMTTSDGVSSSGLYGFKNRIINGGMAISQRYGTTSTVVAGNIYSLDRWRVDSSQASKFSFQQQPIFSPQSCGNNRYTMNITSLAATTVGASDFYGVNQFIEGFNMQDLGWGTSAAQTVTLSFWIYATVSGTYSGAIRTGDGSNYSYPFTYTINSANTWEFKTVTIPGPAAGTWGTGTSVGLDVWFSVGTGSTLRGPAGAWAAANYVGATGEVALVNTNAAAWYITGVQLEKGSTATSFDYRPYGTELMLCQRYYEKSYELTTVPGGATGTGMLLGPTADTSTNLYTACSQVFRVEKRTTPTARYWDVAGNLSRTSLYTGGGLTRTDNNNNVWGLQPATSGLYIIVNTVAANFFALQWEMSAEL